ncbi:MAG TPA: lysylphosphatidylglycerol synthase transmembrane domain-containing protein [Solirubrobacteraceae bacterium]|nr:lysylphosphatidylglycerol synthase transmembrane domain-containing protein [Solirubrobacteraceae bacterium]
METPAPASPRPAPPQSPDPAAPVETAPRRGSRASWIGVAISVVAVAGVVYWATQQSAPRLPHDAGEWFAVVAAVMLYAVATFVRGERWQRLLVDEGGTPSRRDSQEINVIGYMGNNLLPARAGDAIRVVLMAPRAGLLMRSVVGTLLAERLLDVGLLVLVFVIVGYGLLGEVGADKVEYVLLAAAAAAVFGTIAYLLVRRNEKAMAFLAPIASATLGLRRAHHGLRLLALTMVIWAIEAGVWMASAAGVGFGMTPIEGLYIVALASIFAMIPSGPAYAGTQDAAAIIGIKALGATSAQAVAYVVMLRFVIVVPITVAGLALLVTRYGGLGRLRTARA